MSHHRICCCTATVTCVVCSGSTAPEQYQVVISDWDLCGCDNLDTDVHYRVFGDLNGTWTLDHVSSSSTQCVWEVETDLILKTYDNSVDCEADTNSTSSTALDLSFTVTKIGSNYFRTLSMIGGGGGQIYVFYQLQEDGTSAPDCTEELELSNASDTCFEPVGGGSAFGINGTAVITAI